MQYNQLGQTADRVSTICLGTMTWGEQNSEADAHDQLDVALEHGVNFIDTAEMYPFPCTGETCGDTERFIGSWLARRGGRERLLLATKVSGNADGLEWIRGGPRLTPKQIREAVEGSLQRLQTDYIDLYQIHWPARRANYFGRLAYEPHDEDGTALEVIEETLDALAQLVEDGRIRHVGISNETPWGTMQYLRLAEEKGLPRVASIQNPYSLLNRTFETGLAEIAHRERVSLLPYSPLGFGVLTGKYAHGARPEGARLTLFPRFGRYTRERAVAAADAYAALAREHGLTPTQLALAYVRQRPFVASTIIGATSRAQLEEDLATVEVRLDDATLEAIEAIHQENPNPAP
ncbi:MAG: NADP(H)-dependent aldo-keto reductase [Halofilum sp. (in: g-proteobacteria)]|nr:NADP(H)-dependent aldo-keto reductase [Halofilum sp. (in: g-proteobacteria)]